MSEYLSFYNFLKDIQNSYFGSGYDWDSNPVFDDVFERVQNTSGLSTKNIEDGYIDHYKYHKEDVIQMRDTCPKAVAMTVVRADIKLWEDERVKIHYALAREKEYNNKYTECFYFRVDKK